MMNREFYRYKDSPYTYPLKDDQVDEIVFGIYGKNVWGEMAMVWYDGSKFCENRPIARLECYEDAFEALGRLTDVIAVISNKKMLQPDEFVEILLSHGFVNRNRGELYD